MTFDQRVYFLAKVLKGTSPQRRGWAGEVKQGIAQSRFQEVIGNVADSTGAELAPWEARVHRRTVES